MILKEQNKKNKIFYILIFISVLIFLNAIDSLRRASLDHEYIKIKEFEDSYKKSFIKSFFFDNIINDMKNFRKINCDDILLDNLHVLKNDTPDISVIIIVYNQANCFYSALRSVQNQSLKNIEIIIVDDCSLDNTSYLIEKYMEEDKRIIYLKHESNDGKIKSRSDGIRAAKGKYITIIDGDDTLSHKDILFNSLTIANYSNLDVVEFRHALFQKKYSVYIYNNLENVSNLKNRIIYQPELAFKFVDLKNKNSIYGIANRNIVSKLIKTDILKKVLEYIGPKYTEDYLLYYEDLIMSISLFHIANSYYYMHECGYYVARGEFEETYPLLNYKKCKPKNFKINIELDPFKYLNFLLDISKGQEIESKLIYKELCALNHNKKLEKRINRDFQYAYEILDKIVKSTFYTPKMKMKIIQIKNNLLKKEKSIKVSKMYLL